MNLLNVFNRIVENGGATYNLYTGELNPDNGYMVAQKGFEKVFAFDSNPNAFSEQIKSYLTKDIMDQISNRIDLYLGFWLHEGKIYFDIVERIDSLETALTEGKRNGQKAIYDAANKKEIFLTVEVSADPDFEDEKNL